MRTVALLHPGAMGTSVGAAAAGNARVVWASEGRSADTRARAVSAGLEDIESLTRALEVADLVISVCPPHAAEDVAREVATRGYARLYLDANAISPDRTRRIADVLAEAGAQLVDGGIIGGPAWRAGTTRLYLSGERAAEVAAVFEGSPLETSVLDGPVGAASALKMAYAAYSKGSAALVAGILALATHEGVHDALLEEWARREGRLARDHERMIGAAVPKAWRYVGEMDEIAATFAAAGLPSGFHEAASALYRRLERYKDAAPPPPTAEVIAELLRE
ncbi:MAG: NAD(P)-dependent oxidoreductase [Dehalococcoidia bacterium]|nr:NAD(P)-dependent oxidoreductase [Dehalococcoidia bacterium]